MRVIVCDLSGQERRDLRAAVLADMSDPCDPPSDRRLWMREAFKEIREMLAGGSTPNAIRAEWTVSANCRRHNRALLSASA